MSAMMRETIRRNAQSQGLRAEFVTRESGIVDLILSPIESKPTRPPRKGTPRPMLRKLANDTQDKERSR